MVPILIDWPACGEHCVWDMRCTGMSNLTSNWSMSINQITKGSLKWSWFCLALHSSFSKQLTMKKTGGKSYSRLYYCKTSEYKTQFMIPARLKLQEPEPGSCSCINPILGFRILYAKSKSIVGKAFTPSLESCHQNEGYRAWYG